MYMAFKIKCKCGSTFVVNTRISTETVNCPNCGLKSPFSEKVLTILKTASEIVEDPIPHSGLQTDFWISLCPETLQFP